MIHFLNTLRHNVPRRRNAAVLFFLAVFVIPTILAVPAQASALVGIAPLSPPASTQTVLQGVVLIARGSEDEDETDPDGFTDSPEATESQGDEDEDETDPDGLTDTSQGSVTSRILAYVARLLFG